MKAQLIHDQAGEKTFVLVFATGDEAIAGLTAFAKGKKLAASHFTAIGGFQEATLGYFNLGKNGLRQDPGARASGSVVACRRHHAHG
jgi:predicted DNA-binding protein with PD1-like motif